MKITKLKALYFLFILSFAISCNQDIKNDSTDEKGAFDCIHMVDYEERLRTDPIFTRNRENLERLTQEYLAGIRETNTAGFRSTVVTIPVVVHVVHKNATENISVAKIQSQIDALNNFFRRANADVSTVPAPFNTLAADVRIEFELAKRDPNCQPTTGITRTSTTTSSFSNVPLGSTAQIRNAVKFNASGGANGWPSDQYLNLWSCDLAGTSIGYASFPEDLAARPTEDGVVMDYMAFGTVAPVFATLNLGRVCGHEVGHWLNLRHIWGDDCPTSNQCAGIPAGSDFVADTPNQECNNSGFPSFPVVDACTASSPGVMFMNQMDYTDDACRRLFTNDQSDRMAATLFTVRNSLLSSQGALPPPSSATADLWMKDTDDDLGNEPNNESTTFYISDDIWVRNTNDGLTDQESLNPQGGGTNYVYVRVRNKGCQPSAAGATLRLYWAKASTGLSWTAPWDGSVTLSGTSTLMGQPFTPQTIGSIPGNGFQIFEFPWPNTPDPSDYSSLGSDLRHFCLLARIEEPGGMTIPETLGNLGGNVKNNNNIVWKNITIDDTDGSGFVNTLISNFSEEANEFRIVIDGQKWNGDKEIDLRRAGNLYATFDKELNELIDSRSINAQGLQKTNDGTYLVENGMASLNGLQLKPNKHHIVNLKYVPNEEYIFNRFVHLVDVAQINEKDGTIIGGQQFKFKFDRR